jgi:hypothetical protein
VDPLDLDQPEPFIHPVTISGTKAQTDCSPERCMCDGEQQGGNNRPPVSRVPWIADYAAIGFPRPAEESFLKGF